MRSVYLGGARFCRGRWTLVQREQMSGHGELSGARWLIKMWEEGPTVMEGPSLLAYVEKGLKQRNSMGLYNVL